MISALLQLIFALAFLAVACIFTYKIALPLILKIINLSMNSAHFRMGISIFLAVAFSVVGILQLKDFLEEPVPGLSGFFFLSFLVSVIFLFLGFSKGNLNK